MTVRELLEIIESERKLHPTIEDYVLATIRHTTEEYEDWYTTHNTMRVRHGQGIVIIEAS